MVARRSTSLAGGEGQQQPQQRRAEAAAASEGTAEWQAPLTEALVWVDCEMTGLGADGGPGKDKLLEVACILTDADLNIVDVGPDLVIHQPDEVLNGMSTWCRQQFGYNSADSVTPGLLADQVRRSTTSVSEADEQLFDFVSRHLVKGSGILAGNTVHMDKRFLDRYCPRFVGHLHYRLVDVSTIKELSRRWHPEELAKAPAKRGSHRAFDDIMESIKELRYYRKAIFKPPAA